MRRGIPGGEVPPIDQPIGTLVDTLVGVMSEGAQGLAGAPGATPAAVVVHEPRVAGSLNVHTVRQLLQSAQPAMEGCRVAGQATRLQSQLHVAPGGRITVAGPGPGNSGPPQAAQCCADAARQAVPAGWNPGPSGVVFFDVTLPAR